MKVMVTGANGFVGSQLCPLLESAGLEVVRVVRQPAAGAIAIGSIDGQTDWTAAIAGAEAVIHLAARAHILKETQADPLAVFRAVNTAGTANLARQAARAGIKRFIFISSIGVHGRISGPTPFSVQDTLHPHDAYSISKKEAEEELRKIARETGLEIVIIRPPLVYGPGVGANFRRLIKLAGSGIPLPLAAIKNRRSLVYVGNLGHLIRVCLDHPRAAGQTFLVSDDQDASTAELLHLLAAVQNKKARLFPFPERLLALAGRLTGRAYEIERLCGSLLVDIAHTKTTLGWHPPVSLEEGLRLSFSAAAPAREAIC